ncbi:uncharacterized protein LOC125582370 [Brassica napus]|uniref:uncharacterized protein LOC125582370 n=1 Tax=Brassica napus TaxID=3708 RepID=UPI0020784E41|nr:uncharacterized protein LOC125582370 [Brassica napus]
MRLQNVSSSVRRRGYKNGYSAKVKEHERLAKLMHVSDQRKSRWRCNCVAFLPCPLFYEEENGNGKYQAQENYHDHICNDLDPIWESPFVFFELPIPKSPFHFIFVPHWKFRKPFSILFSYIRNSTLSFHSHQVKVFLCT